MKKILLGLLLLGGVLTATEYRTSEAAAHLGEHATVYGTVDGGYYAKRTRGRPTFINLDGNYPHQSFTVVIWGRDRHKFHAPEQAYLGQRICVTGTIGSYRGTPQIVVSDPGQIR
ncbi:hypothetical protein [Nitratifractor sp.]